MKIIFNLVKRYILKIENRKEYKLLFDESELSSFLLKNSKNLQVLFPNRIIESLYFDTVNFDLYKKSKLNDVGKFKIRVRKYSNSTNFYKEIKLNNGLTKSKEKVKLEINSFEDLSKIFYRGNIYFPSSYIKYTRSYFKFHKTRLTIDQNIAFFTHNYRTKIHRSVLLSEKVIEFKNLGELSDVEKFIEYNPVAFSKYNSSIEKLYNLKYE